MTTPGSNLLQQALRIIKPQLIPYYQYQGRTQNQARQWVNLYAPPQNITASVQMVSRSLYQKMGLDYQKIYLKVFAMQGVIDIARETSSDKFVWNGWEYQVDSNNDWFLQDGWVSCLVVRTVKAS